MQNPVGVEVVKTEEDLLRVPDDDGLGEWSVLLQKVGHRAAGHPLDEQVDGAALLHGPEYPNNVPKKTKISI